MRERLKMLVSAIAIVLMLTACGADKETRPIHLAIVSGYHLNAPAPPVTSETLGNMVYEGAISYGTVSIVVVDGNPYIAGSYRMGEVKKGLSKSKRAQIAEKQREKILSIIRTSKARSAEVDTLSAIAWAARGLMDTEGEKKMLISDSGLQTKGYLDFTKNLLRANPESVVEYLEEKHALPDLTGIEIKWIGLGDVCGEQEALTPENLQNMREIWEKVLFASGAKSVEFMGDYPSSEKADNLPNVTAVPILKEPTIDWKEGTETEEALETPFILDEKKVLFKPDTADFANPETAVQTLQPLADWLKAHSDVKVGLAGTTATAGTNEGCRKLSRERATAVMEMLLDLGMPEEQVTVVLGLGYNHPYHIPDLNVDGSQNANAPANRSVIIFNVESETGKQIMEYQ